MAEHANVRYLTLLAGTGVRRTKAPGCRLLPDGREVPAFGLGFAARDAFVKGFDDADRRYFGDVEISNGEGLGSRRASGQRLRHRTSLNSAPTHCENGSHIRRCVAERLPFVAGYVWKVIASAQSEQCLRYQASWRSWADESRDWAS